MPTALTKKQIQKTIQKLMIDKEITGARIARKAKCTRQNVYHVIGGRQVSPHIRAVIAAELGVKTSDLWPDEKADKNA